MYTLKELRKYKIKINDETELAMFDVVGTALFGYLIARKTGYSPLVIVPGTFLLGEGMHAVFDIDTPGLRYLNDKFSQ